MDGRDWTFAQASRLREHYVEREPRMLSELATWVRATNGPITQLDGSIASLVPMYEWYVQFVDAGSAGIPRWARSSMHDPNNPLLEASDVVHAGRYAAQAVQHYLHIGVETVGGRSPWSVYVDPRHGRRELRHHSICLPRRAPMPLFPDAGIAEPWSILAKPPSLEQRQIDRARDPETLRRAVALGWDVVDSSARRPPLTDLPDVQTRPPQLNLSALLGPGDAEAPTHVPTATRRPDVPGRRI